MMMISEGGGLGRRSGKWPRELPDANSIEAQRQRSTPARDAEAQRPEARGQLLIRDVSGKLAPESWP